MNPGFIAAVVTVAAAAGVLLLLGQIKNGFDSESDLEGVTGVASPSIVRFAQAIARAEGFGLPGVIPTLAHNPGDLKIPGWSGPTMGQGISVFANDADGWDRLYRQLMLIVSGKSHIYSLSDTISTMAAKWTSPTEAAAWGSNVAAVLGVPESSTLRELIGGAIIT